VDSQKACVKTYIDNTCSDKHNYNNNSYLFNTYQHLLHPNDFLGLLRYSLLDTGLVGLTYSY